MCGFFDIGRVNEMHAMTFLAIGFFDELSKKVVNYMHGGRFFNVSHVNEMHSTSCQRRVNYMCKRHG